MCNFIFGNSVLKIACENDRKSKWQSLNSLLVLLGRGEGGLGGYTKQKHTKTTFQGNRISKLDKSYSVKGTLIVPIVIFLFILGTLQ